MERYYIILISVVVLGIYFVQAISFYKLSINLKIENTWVAFIPFLQNILLLKIINKTVWYALLFLIPIVNVIAYIVFYVKFYEYFNIDMPWIILCIIVLPIGQIMLLYIAFSKLLFLDQENKVKSINNKV
ncbi:DUF5684 domain-containing protein [Haloimpatiens sp. FM7330]|uniref:DUF5684 domain-containing protein n=1 Tax=Haloimpatiens sp. FM7330 TaxID=3298610 RepID=UPI00362B9B3C